MMTVTPSNMLLVDECDKRAKHYDYKAPIGACSGVQQSIRQGDIENDDEFDFAFEGGERTQQYYQPEVRFEPVPLKLLTDLSQKLTTVIEECDELTSDPLLCSSADITNNQIADDPASCSASDKDDQMDEWAHANQQYDEIKKLSMAEPQDKSMDTGLEQICQPQPVGYETAERFIVHTDDRNESNKPQGQYNGILQLVRRFAPYNLLTEEQSLAVDNVIALSNTVYSENNAMHWNVLRSLYYYHKLQSLTATSQVPSIASIQRFGGHWLELGFQGNDPSTDFRGSGILCLLQLTYFYCLNSQKSRKILSRATNPAKGFPFAITSVNVTAWCIDLLNAKSKQLIGSANNTEQLLNQLHLFHSGCLRQVVQQFESDRYCEDDIGVILSNVRNHASQHIKYTKSLGQDLK